MRLVESTLVVGGLEPLFLIGLGRSKPDKLLSISEGERERPCDGPAIR
ncbi:hypothetical protein CIRG_00733 [Coccidioides immitis RMSCC 2394]|uniref:Uncharacterized protein n=1 Tax=Coccidioides immitis RMSCC 2394 TaxID=404692 RepID=A0A0J6XWN5_COCIT|nr:hypothetical protein CIRG_00733 [Coccidioides immitis RMSCC 2394]